jgi:translation initiation factor IF-2
MADTKNPGDKPLSVGTKTLSLKPRTETGVVRQSFSHGRTKQVVVEKKTKRRLAGDPAPAAETPVSAPAPAAAPVKAAPRPEPARPASRTSGVVLRTLTEDEQSARASALADARVREEEERRAAEAEAARRNTKEFKEQQEREAAEARKKAEEERHRAEEEAKARAEREANKRTEAAAKAATAPAPKTPSAPARPAAVAADGSDDDEAPRMVRRPGGGVARPVVAAKPTAKPAPAKQRGRLTLSTALNADEVRERSIASFRRRTQRLKGHASNEPKEKLIREVVIPEAITIQELANRMTERAVDVIRLLMKQGAMHKITDVIDADTAQLIAEEMGHTVKRVAASDVEEGLFDVAEDHASDTTPRPPVVTVMGHVDHGKTSLLDALRHANVVSGEAGGITQHIGAYQVTSPESGKKITFIDTPGHAAFTAMRARGAKVTDIVILVVAADDGVMPQTIEAINHAKAAGVPMIVAINKIDKPDAKPERVRTELLQHEVQVESFGGEVVDVEVSAKNKTNLDKLLEMIALQADLLDLKTNPDRPAEGTVIEAKLDRGRGPVATVLVQRGTLRVGDIIVAGAEMGRVRALINDQGETVQEAGPSVPVEVLGFNGPPEAGDRLAVVENEARARQVTDYRAHQKREKTAASSGMRGSLEQMMSQLKTTGRKDFPLVIKADVQGSLEAILGSLEKLGTDEVAARILHAGVGGISESDVTLAEGFNAAIIGFSVRANKEAAALAKRNGIEIRYYNIIYDLVDDVKKAMSGLLAPTLRETMLGNAQILEVFNISKVGKIAGCRVTDGSVERGANVRLIRDNVVVHEGKLSTLKRFKDEVKEVQSGQECGMAFENYQDMRVGDVIECYRVETIQRSL